MAAASGQGLGGRCRGRCIGVERAGGGSPPSGRSVLVLDKGHWPPWPGRLAAAFSGKIQAQKLALIGGHPAPMAKKHDQPT